MTIYLSDFAMKRPAFELSQSEIASWLAAAHLQSKKTETPEEDCEEFAKRLTHYLKKLTPKIDKRGFEIRDILHRNWEEMEIFSIGSDPSGQAIDKRVDFFHQKATAAFEEFYPDGKALPDQLLHVTCTGYAAPSAAQLLAIKRDRGEQCTVTHVYHMGCYAAISAIRIASGMLHQHVDQTADVVHTELGSLHLDPSRHSIDQLVIQSLFSDGYIRYRLSTQKRSDQLEVLRLQDEIVPNSHHLMDWRLGRHAMRFILFREVPEAISNAINGYMKRLLEGKSWSDCYFAIHPGGIKIIEQIAELLKLEPWQYRHSLDILARYGNMSSATTPHVWQALLNDSQVPQGAQIVSMAFGPGITISGGVLIKQ